MKENASGFMSAIAITSLKIAFTISPTKSKWLLLTKTEQLTEPSKPIANGK